MRASSFGGEKCFPGLFLIHPSNKSRAGILLRYILDLLREECSSYSWPFSKAFRFRSRKFDGTESAIALRTASALSTCYGCEEPTITEFEHHALAEFLGQARGRAAVDAGLPLADR